MKPEICSQMDPSMTMHRDNGKKVMAVRPHLQSSSSTVSLPNPEQINSLPKSVSSLDIFTVLPNPRRKQAVTIDLRGIKSISS